MKFSTVLPLAAFVATEVAAHATFQQLWINGVDQGGVCVRRPNSNSPIQDPTSSDIVCNANTGPAASKCGLKAGDTVTIEVHQQNGERSCGTLAIGGSHWGPIIVYLSKVSDSSTANPASGGWFKIFEDGWAKKSGSTRGDDDYWGVKDIENCCGKMNVKIPSDIAPGDYFLRAEFIALHAATPSGGAQFYMSCYQLSITGGGSATPATVKFPGAYSQSDPGIGLSIHGNLNSYTVPGPAVYSGGTIQVAGSGTCPSGGSTTNPTTTRGGTGTTLYTTTTTRAQQQTTTTTTTTSAAGNSGGSGAPLYGQCGGNGWTGPKTCAQGRCVANGDWYSQCVP